MTWEEHFAELKHLRKACEQNQSRFPRIIYKVIMGYLDALEADRYCKGEDPYKFLWSQVLYYTDFTPNSAECNSAGYPTTVREASKRLRGWEQTEWQVGRLLGYADWIQVHGWKAVNPQAADELRRSYHNAGIDPEAIDFLAEPD